MQHCSAEGNPGKLNKAIMWIYSSIHDMPKCIIFTLTRLQMALHTCAKCPLSSYSHDRCEIQPVFTSRILIRPLFLMQILDFGLARSTDAEMTGYVVTRWYRAPEVILNWMHYTQTGKTIIAVAYSHGRPRCCLSWTGLAVLQLFAFVMWKCPVSSFTDLNGAFLFVGAISIIVWCMKLIWNTL